MILKKKIYPNKVRERVSLNFREKSRIESRFGRMMKITKDRNRKLVTIIKVSADITEKTKRKQRQEREITQKRNNSNWEITQREEKQYGHKYEER